MKTGLTKEDFLDDQIAEFPLINSRYTGQKSKYSYLQRFESSKIMRFDALMKYDSEKNTTQVYEYGEGKFGTEAPFIPAENAKEEDDGYVITFVTDERDQTSEAIIVDAKNVDKGHLARIKIPQQVPLGFHGCWINGDRMLD